ncbi:asparagine synthase (glutamine-hydrolyzing) [Streptomyces sp. NPDC088789]|uniref:asparagine synthase (glutamine-hydrolyzing) n=1 Tax=Streptomyces sp. NPDC088789 TaxID=3365899 RepID=UPI00381520D2
MTGAVFSGCGIAGALLTSAPDTPGGRPGAAAVRRMTDALAHRGPHSAGLWERPGIVLGHRRLAVTGIGAAGDQPMTRGHLTIVYNGETYNAPALRTELAGEFAFTTRTDTEVVLRAWQRWGSGALSRLEGMYAFAMWDARARELTLVRDRIGIKPLYWHRGDGFVLFASEIGALLASGHVPARPDTERVIRQLLVSTTLSTDLTRTPVAGVRALAPATARAVRPDGGHAESVYWALPPSPDQDRPVDPVGAARELGGLLSGSVERMLMGDVPVAAFLSGGLDSCAITALAARPQGALPCVTTAYGTGGVVSAEGNEDWLHSRTMAAHLGGRVRHHRAVRAHTLTLDDLDAVCDLAAVGDDPRHAAILANYRTVRDLGLRVVLNGQGADEILGGYVARPAFVRHLLDVAAPDPATVNSLPASRQVAGLTPAALAGRRAAHDEVLGRYHALPGPPLERVHRLLFHTQLARILTFEDFLSMRMSVEARFPFLDHHLVAWAFAQPFHTHIHAPTRTGKTLLRAALGRLLPAPLLTRPKAVFPSPDTGIVRASLAALVTEHRAELDDDPLVNALFTLPADPTAAPVSHLWGLLSLWRWHHALNTARRTVPQH